MIRFPPTGTVEGGTSICLLMISPAVALVPVRGTPVSLSESGNLVPQFNLLNKHCGPCCLLNPGSEILNSETELY